MLNEKQTLMLFYLLLILTTNSNSYFTTEGGNITSINATIREDTNKWAGVYGFVINGGSDSSLNLSPENISELDLSYELGSNCGIISIHAIAYNQTISGILFPGNLSLLDLLINASENASKTFNLQENLNLSYGLITNVPYTYTLSKNSTNVFKTYYLNDQNNNLIFVSNIIRKPNWAGNLSDYQMLIPKIGINFTITIDKVMVCNNSNNSNNKRHKIYIYPINKITIKVGKIKEVNATIKNKGNYNERDIVVSINNKDENYILKIISLLSKGEEKTVHFNISKNKTGLYVYEIEGKNEKCKYLREFLVEVVPECSSDIECGEGEICNKEGFCEREYCIGSYECKEDEECKDGNCERIECGCGYIENHECINYECCNESECGLNEVCYEHKCEELRPNLEYNESYPGENITIKVTDPFGNPWIGYIIIDGIEYKLKNGEVVVPYPKKKVVYVIKGRNKYGFILNLKELAEIKINKEVFIDEKIEGQVVDGYGNPIGRIKIFLIKDGKILKEIYTDKDSRFYFMVKEKGTYELYGSDKNYVIKKISFYAKERECSFPYKLNFIKIKGEESSYLWIIAILSAVITIFLFPSNLLSYFITTLILIIPFLDNKFNICLVSNVESLLAMASIIFKSIKRFRKK